MGVLLSACLTREKHTRKGAARAAAVPAHASGAHNLSPRGARNAASFGPEMQAILKVFQDQYDADTNPAGIVVLGVADNSLLRGELLQYFNAPGRLHLSAPEMTYANRVFASARLLDALAGLYNEVPDGLPPREGTHEAPRLIHAVKEKHIVVGTGATGILDAVAWVLCGKGDGIMLSTPAYNAFFNDFTVRAEASIVEVPTSPADKLSVAQVVDKYEEALQQAKKAGTHVRMLLLCNPHNPTGCIYPREHIVALARFAAKHDLHLVSDEIYARSCFRTLAVPDPPQFHSVLSMDLQKEAGLPLSRLHVVTSASKDFSINGFRLGVFISQGNPEAVAAMTALGIMAQASSPAGNLWFTLLEDREYCLWFLAEQRRRLAAAFNYVAAWAAHHDIPLAPANAGHFLLIDLSRFAGGTAKGEAALTGKFIEKKVFVAPGAQYHHPQPGFFRLTFSVEPKALQVGLARVEETLGLERWIAEQPPLSFGDSHPPPRRALVAPVA